MGTRLRLALGIHSTAPPTIGADWMVRAAAVIAGRTTEATLGYFLDPMVTVALRVLVLRERLRPLQWVTLGDRRGELAVPEPPTFTAGYTQGASSPAHGGDPTDIGRHRPKPAG